MSIRSTGVALRLNHVISVLMAVTTLVSMPAAWAQDETDSKEEPARVPIDFSGFDIYAREGYILTHRYLTEAGAHISVIDTTEASMTKERQPDGSSTHYETLQAVDGQIALEQISRFDADGRCQSRYKTRYQWLTVFPAVVHEGDQLQRLAKVTDFDHEQPCGQPDRRQAPIESAIRVTYTVLGRTEYRQGPVQLENCVRLTEKAPDYSGVATICAGVGTAYRLRTGTNFGRNERQLIDMATSTPGGINAARSSTAPSAGPAY